MAKKDFPPPVKPTSAKPNPPHRGSTPAPKPAGSGKIAQGNRATPTGKGGTKAH